MATIAHELWRQNGATEIAHDGAPICLIEIGNRVSVELTGSITNEVGPEEVQQAAELIMAAPALAKLLALVEPHLDAIVCFASDMGEHKPNAIAGDVRGWLGHLRDLGALPAFASTGPAKQVSA